ncbi:TPR repeat-containing protein DDB_G0287407-like [Hydractinia symbiolongicarpus]|uniref:TPR repeat-containing protein DDB_G0287407-like n=1 Tax=Hydractinia symbiolongicarpus TaxID=13093 RepID=UPI00254FAD01|nr:TPR repeat-containing protein DDB_G0287407-like [Hydractinia symbiolongicarpus]
MVYTNMGCGSSKNTSTIDTSNTFVEGIHPTVIKECSLQHLRDRPLKHNMAYTNGLLTYEKASKLKLKNVNQMWDAVKQTSDTNSIHVEPIKNRKGWRTIRIFVSSTFKDFQQEREILVKEVFPDLRLWCEQRKLRLVECDLRWGVPKDSTTEETIKICLSELDRCYEDNVAPFFLNLTGDRAGWIPKFGDLSDSLAAQYGWIYGLSVTEMEIVHGAFRKLNPNAQSSMFVHNITYKLNKESPINRIGILTCRMRKNCQTFLDNWSRCVLGRDKLTEQIKSYIHSSSAVSSLLLVGNGGAGKSAVMAKCASDILRSTHSNEKVKWRVFFHFVGATPGSTDLAFFLQRLTKEVKPDMKDTANDLETLIQLSNSLLSNPNTKPIVLFIDGVNQFDEDKQQYLRRWLPDKLSSNVRVVVSTIENTESHHMFKMCKPQPSEILCGALDTDSRKEIVNNFLSVYNKRLDEEQLDKLLAKEGSSNPLWLSVACEELRVFGRFEELIEKIESLPNELISLEMEVFSRFEAESGGPLMKATLCLLEVSRHGLLETELLALLGDDNNIKCPDYVEGSAPPIKGEAEFFSSGAENIFHARRIHRQKSKQVNYLPARDWAIIYRNLKQLLRPCGDLGEGRLDFYHRSLSKAVRRMYFKGSEECRTHMYTYWHEVLAKYFENNHDDVDRKAEELPFHLEQLMDDNRLMRCLLDWPLFNRLYNEDFSIDLLGSWQKAGGYAVAAALYKESLFLLKESDMPLSELAEQMEMVAMFLIQAGQYSVALSLLEERLQYEKDQLGERTEKLADIYQLMTLCKSEVVKQHPLMYKYMYRFLHKSQLVEHTKVVELLRKTNGYRKKLNGKYGEQQKFKIAINNILLCFHLTIMALLDPTCAEDYRSEGFQVINEAMNVFEKINDLGHLSDAIMTKTFMNANASFEEKKKQLKQALELCLRAYGKGHLMYIRLCLSIGLLHEQSGDYYTAYEYFSRWDNAAREVYGPNHIKTIRSKEALDSPVYRRIKEEKEKAETS